MAVPTSARPLAAAAAGRLAAGSDGGLRGEVRGGGGRVARYRPRVAPDQSDAGVRGLCLTYFSFQIKIDYLLYI